MINNIEALKNACLTGEVFKYLLFWGHTPSHDGTINSSCLSQWWPCSFTEKQTQYSSAEQYMMAAKADLFEDHEIFQQILKTNDPKMVKALGRKVKHFDEVIWKNKRFELVVRGNILKFSQNQVLSDFLSATGNRILVEASPYDRIWGIGMGKDHEFAQNPMKWRGQNLLGFALMAVREQLTLEEQQR